MTTQKRSSGQIEGMAAIPEWWVGSLPEYLVYAELLRRGKKDGEDFTYQSKQLGGRLEKGGLVLDFVFSDPPDLAINVQGDYFHYEQGRATIQNDRMQRAQMAGLGITLIFIDESDILKDVGYYVGEALNYRDHSRLGRG